mgnify:CR=1 FL=1
MSKIIGIDLGTTNSVVAVMEAGEPVDADPHAAEPQREERDGDAAASPHFKRPITSTVSPDHTVEQVDVPVVGNGTDSRSAAALAQLRDKLIPATIGRVPGATADVAGYTASSADFNDTLKSHAPVVFIFVLTAAIKQGIPLSTTIAAIRIVRPEKA